MKNTEKCIVVMCSLGAAFTALQMSNYVSRKHHPTPAAVSPEPAQATAPATNPVITASNLDDDFIMKSKTAVSNANLWGAPPPGYGVACDGNGHYAACDTETGGIYASFDEMVRTNYFEATVAAWRVKEIKDAAGNQELNHPSPVVHWKICE